jgi:hypothetical protein
MSFFGLFKKEKTHKKLSEEEKSFRRARKRYGGIR